MAKDRKALKIDIDCDVLWKLHAKLSHRETSTAKVAEWLSARAWDRPATNNFIQLPLPVPIGRKKVLMLYMRLFCQLRSPTYRKRGRFVAIATPDDIERVRAHIAGLASLYGHAPVLGGEWQLYLQDALSALKPRVSGELVTLT